jgi:hypothetical protein
MSAAIPGLDLSRVTLVGNAKGDWQPADEGLTLVFNGTRHPQDGVINIANGGFAGCDAPFVVTGSGMSQSQARRLEQRLTEIARTLESRLDCWPSSGLTAFMLALQYAADLPDSRLSVQRMSLLPSLAREAKMSTEDYLPCMVHNWLGERRLVLTALSELAKDDGLDDTKIKVHWPELLLKVPEYEIQESVDESGEQHSPLASLLSLALPMSQMANHQALMAERDLQGKILLQLANTPLFAWRREASLSALKTCEPLFFNHSPEISPSPWYLLDNAASQYLNPIRLKLALCQQSLLLG